MFIQGSSLSRSLTGTNQRERWDGGCGVGQGGANKIGLTWVIYRFICVLVQEPDLHYSCPQRSSTEDISWLTPAQVRPHYFNGHCEGRPLSPVVGAREGEEKGGRRRAQLIYSNQRALFPYTENRWGHGIIIQLPLLTVNNAQRFNAQKRRIIGNRMPGDF